MLNSIYSVISNTALVILISVAMCMTLPSFFTNPAANYTTVSQSIIKIPYFELKIGDTIGV